MGWRADTFASAYGGDQALMKTPTLATSLARIFLTGCVLMYLGSFLHASSTEVIELAS